MSYRSRGRGRSGGSGDVSSRYSQHDDRTGPPSHDYDKGSFRGKMGNYRSNYRGNRGSHYRGSRGRGYNYGRGNFRSNRGRRPYRGGPRPRSYQQDQDDSSPLAEDSDGDVPMDGEVESNRYNPYARPNKDRRPRYQYESAPRRKPWYQISIVDGSKYDQDWLREEIQNQALIQFHPIQYHLDGDKSSFFVDDDSTAEAIKGCSKKIISPDGTRIIILMRYGDNISPFDDSQVEKIKEVLGKRFDSTKQHLDCSALYHDSKLKEQRIQLRISTSYHIFVVSKVIAENISSLVSLDLSENYLNHLDGLKLLITATQSLKKLNLKKNNLKNLKELEKIKDWDLTELTLDQNPFCTYYISQTEYVSDIREIFPNVTILDEHNLPPPVKFDVESGKLPKSIRNFLPPVGQEIMQQFIQDYFSCYDQSRQSLSAAYHEDCIFTLSIPSSPRGPSLNKYFQQSRNLKRIKASQLKTSTVSASRDQTLAKLSKLPDTKHVQASFAIDVPLITGTIVHFIVRGLFKEGGRDGYMRAFSKSFFCEVNGQSLKIINEQCFIRNPTSIELKEMKTLPTTSTLTVTPAQTQQAQPDRLKMIEAFSSESGMNIAYSEQCLSENNWNYAEAGKVFLALKEQGKIPPAAFAK